MLKKTYRLSSVKMVSFKKITSESFDVKIAKNNLEISRFGFVVSKKIDKKAVVRNSVKRKLSKSVEEIFDRIEGGRDIVFYPRQVVSILGQKELDKELGNVFKKEGILND